MSDIANIGVQPHEPGGDAAKARSLQSLAGLGAVTSVMLRSPAHRRLFMSDLEWMVLPALANGQFSVAEARDPATGFSMPVGVALWATVSDEVDQRLMAGPALPLRLRPAEWKSGPIVWLIEAIGDQRAVSTMVGTIIDRHFPAGMKAVVRGPDGKPTVQLLQRGAAAPTA
jgi:hemolysin-activating ACP:hemolysin acyltransferase